MIKLLPIDMRDDYKSLLVPTAEDNDNLILVKAADALCAYIKCLEERVAGNHEFSRAERSIEKKIQDLKSLPEVLYFMEKFMPGFSLTLDEISRPLEI
jgi:5'-deoxynucleotidase